ncbi:MAG: hypothetical protein K8E66_04855, partial [Phycisphaerales bacterium]|nr:hypothetical protein [Phycisphaerales bacterium]
VRLRVGEAIVLEVTAFTSPCRWIAGSFIDGEFSRIAQDTHPGQSRVYARVLAEGDVAPGDAVEFMA